MVNPSLAHDAVRLWGTGTAATLTVWWLLSASLHVETFQLFAATAVSLGTWAFVGVALSRGLADPTGRETRLGAATGLTLVRAWLITMLSGFLAVPLGTERWVLLPAIIYSAAALGDHLDGRLARRLKQVSRLGAKLDTEVDALGILVASLLAIRYGKLPLWFVSVGLARYVFVAGLGYRNARGLPVAELDPSTLRRLLAGVQMGFLSVSLFPFVSAEATQTCAWIFGGATLLMFVRDWAVVSTRFSPSSPRYLSLVSQRESIVAWILVGIRFSVGLALLRIMFSAPLIWPSWVSWVSVVGFTLLVVGKGARVGAVWILGLLAVYMPYLALMGHAGSIRGALLGSAVILLFGAGPLPLDRLLTSSEPPVPKQVRVPS